MTAKLNPNRGCLYLRLWMKIAIAGHDDCWFWRRGVSRGGYREVDYGIIREAGRGSFVWRVHRLTLALKTAPVDVPQDEDECLADWLKRVRRHYADYEASHTCDESLCVNPNHLAWELHADNIKNQTKRRRTAAA